MVVNVLAMLTVWCVAPAAQHLPIRLIGTVLGHETQIVHALQQRLKPSITVDIARAGDSLRPAAATLLFHRVKPRLPADEIHSLLASLQGGLCAAEMMKCMHVLHRAWPHSKQPALAIPVHLCIDPCLFLVKKRTIEWLSGFVTNSSNDLTCA